ncbi:MAG TPA: hypothetical protein DD666_00705 [Advenella kashmirensis]|uniref:Peptidase S24/S26A/S26B/S26C domain-containing protein n=1 Tax=Advenella kashmirensis TaxID=310575 RepID=A0A356LAR9_9BURK|nr:hypothetical protein [Advenella kashmirensis]
MDTKKLNRRANLLTIITKRYGGNQKACAEAWQMKPPMVSRWLASGKVKDPRFINEESARRIESLENLEEYDLDSDPADFSLNREEGAIVVKKQDAHISVTNAAASMGYGLDSPDFEMIVDTMRVTKSWVNMELPTISSINNLAILPGYGDSMSPTYNSGDLLFVDRGVTNIKDDAIYVFSIDSQLFVKRMIRNPIKKTLIAKSDNDAYGQFEIEEKDQQRMIIHGLIVYAWNKKKL